MLKRNVTLLPFGTNKKGQYFDQNNIVLTTMNYCYGEIDHSKTPNILLANVSHLVENIDYDNLGVYGDIKILDTVNGKLLTELVKADMVVFRPRMDINLNGVATIFTFDAIIKNQDIFYPNNRYLKLKKIYEKLSK